MGRVVDFGAGDARFSKEGRYERYTGYEIDPRRLVNLNTPDNATIINACAFSSDVTDADICIGNPPYVRNQDLPAGWRQLASECIKRRTGITISGLANAWQYFFFLAIASTEADGLVAIVVPFEWVSRPSSAALREYIRRKGWNVSVYRLKDDAFKDVLTTASVTIVDKRSSNGEWSYFMQHSDGHFMPSGSPTGSHQDLLRYESARGRAVYAKRGLSPGTQQYLTLTEGERVHQGLRIDVDVVKCVTTLRPTSAEEIEFGVDQFSRDYVRTGRKCWLVKTNANPSKRLRTYLDSVPTEGRNSSTCRNRELWWRFTMPEPPGLLMASGFRTIPKVFVNTLGAVAVGSVYGVYTPEAYDRVSLAIALRTEDYLNRLVSHSNGLRKLEINQANSLLADISERRIQQK